MRVACGLLLALLPSLWLTWSFRDLPHFGVLQDDSLYYAGAKALAQGDGYRILSLPSEPYQTKYPPLYPLYLLLAWLRNPNFPANLTTALGLAWLALPAALGLLYTWCRRQGLGEFRTWLIVGLTAANPYVIFWAANIGSELFFLVFLMGALVAAEKRGRDDRWWPLAAGLIGGAGYLARTAGIALLPAAIAYFLLRRRARAALWFTAGMLPSVAGWTLWAHLHAAGGHDIVTLCYTSYTGYQFFNVGWDNIGVVLWKNFDALLEAMGSLVFPQMLNGLPAKIVLQPIALAMILGLVRMARRGEALLYSLFAAVSAAMLLVWHFTPNQRFILPLAPILLAGFCSEMTHLAQALRTAFRHRDRSQRVVAYGFTGYLALLLATAAGLQIYMTASVVPELFQGDREHNRAYYSLYRWVDANVPRGAGVVWEQDVVLHLATGRNAASFLIPPREWYAHDEDKNKNIAYFRKIDEYARAQQLGYVMLTKVGSHRNEDVLRALAANPNLERVHEESGGIVYRVR